MFNISGINSAHTGNHNLTHYPDNLPLRCYKYFNILVIFCYYHICTLLCRRQIQKIQKKSLLLLYIALLRVIISKMHGDFLEQGRSYMWLHIFVLYDIDFNIMSRLGRVCCLSKLQHIKPLALPDRAQGPARFIGGTSRTSPPHCHPPGLVQFERH